MQRWRSGLRDAVAMVLTWTLGWGLGLGGVMELVDPDGRIEDVWPPALAIPGFIGGVVFSALLAVAERPRRFDQVSLVRVAIWGVVTGLVLGSLAVAAGVGSDQPRAVALMVAIAVALGVMAAVASATFLRYWAKKAQPL